MFGTFKNLIASSLRYKLLLLVLVPILIVVAAMAGIGIYWSGAFTYDQLLRKVNTEKTKRCCYPWTRGYLRNVVSMWPGNS